jgi:hypothetical protein
MREREPTRIGRVRHVLGSTVTVELDPELAGVAPIYRGQLQSVGQIGSLVRIPQGLVDLLGTVTLLGIAELSGQVPPVQTVQVGERWLQIELLGELDRGTGVFRRGVGSYPGLDDDVHFTVAEELAAVFPSPDDNYLRLGRLAAAEHVPVCVEARKLVMRHAAVVGSTGSGKTSAVASIIQSFARGGWSSANIIVIDPHGEYASALGDDASVLSVLAQGNNRLKVPFWALPASDVLRIFTGSTGGPTVVKRFNELVAEARRDFEQSCQWLTLDAAAITADTPVPFDVRSVWLKLDSENRETRTIKIDPASAQMTKPGDALLLRPAEFAPYAAGSAAPYQSPNYGLYGNTPELLRLGLLDPRLEFFQEPKADPSGSDPLVEAMETWLGGDKPVSVLDFSGVPAEAADMAVGVVLNLLFEVAVRSEFDGLGIGRPSPVLIVLEEAHRYFGEAAGQLARQSANRIAREGRKYGMGLLLVTQRPSELPDTALSQCGTLLALRLSNASDQGKIRAALPDTVAGLAAVLPSLRTGEAVISGEAVVLPARLLIDTPNPWPRAEDPSLVAWRAETKKVDVGPALASWRAVYDIKP